MLFRHPGRFASAVRVIRRWVRIRRSPAPTSSDEPARCFRCERAVHRADQTRDFPEHRPSSVCWQGDRQPGGMRDYDVAVIGGGAAGLSAALVLSRARRAVLVVDAGPPRNAPAAYMHGYLSRDGLSPAELLAAGRSEVDGYGGDILAGTVTRVRPGRRSAVSGSARRRIAARRRAGS